MTRAYFSSKISNFFKKDALLLLISLIVINTIFSLNSNLVLFFALFIMILFLLVFILESILRMFSNIQTDHKNILTSFHKIYINNLNANKNLHQILALLPNTVSEVCLSWKFNDFNVTWVFIDNNKNYLFFTLDNMLSGLIKSENIKNDARFPEEKSSFFKN